MPVGEKIDAMLHSLGVDDVGDSIMSPINMESDGDLFEHAIQRKVSAVVKQNGMKILIIFLHYIGYKNCKKAN